MREEVAEGLNLKLKPIKDTLKELQEGILSCQNNVRYLGCSANETESRLKTIEVENKRLAKEVQQLKEKTLEKHSLLLHCCMTYSGKCTGSHDADKCSTLHRTCVGSEAIHDYMSTQP